MINIKINIYINRYVFFDCSEEIRTGSDCMIGTYVYVTDGDYDFKSGNCLIKSAMIFKPVTTGNHVWTEEYAVIPKGVNIEGNAVIAAVAKNISMGAIIKRVPVK